MARGFVIALAIFGAFMLLYHSLQTLRSAFRTTGAEAVAMPTDDTPIPPKPRDLWTRFNGGLGGRTQAIQRGATSPQGQARIDAIVPQRLALRQGFNLVTADMGPDYTATLFNA